jgi:hypothetical protein
MLLAEAQLIDLLCAQACVKLQYELELMPKELNET